VTNVVRSLLNYVTRNCRRASCTERTFSRHIDEYTHPNWGWILVWLLFSVAGVANLINGYPEHGTEE
jgi:hypothetical protein